MLRWETGLGDAFRARCVKPPTPCPLIVTEMIPPSSDRKLEATESFEKLHVSLAGQTSFMLVSGLLPS